MGGAGAGFMLDTVTSIRNNRKYLPKTRFPDVRARIHAELKARKIELKKATPEQMAAIREKIVREKVRERKRQLLVMLISIPILVLVLWLLAVLVVFLFESAGSQH